MCEEFSDNNNLHLVYIYLIQYKFLFLSINFEPNIKLNILSYWKMRGLIEAHKNLIKTVKHQMSLSDYGMYWLAFLEGGLTVWFIDRLIFHWL